MRVSVGLFTHRWALGLFPVLGQLWWSCRKWFSYRCMCGHVFSFFWIKQDVGVELLGHMISECNKLSNFFFFFFLLPNFSSDCPILSALQQCEGVPLVLSLCPYSSFFFFFKASHSHKWRVVSLLWFYVSLMAVDVEHLFRFFCLFVFPVIIFLSWSILLFYLFF